MAEPPCRDSTLPKPRRGSSLSLGVLLRLGTGTTKGVSLRSQRLANELLPQRSDLLRDVAEAPSTSPQEELRRKKPNTL